MADNYEQWTEEQIDEASKKYYDFFKLSCAPCIVLTREDMEALYPTDREDMPALTIKKMEGEYNEKGNKRRM